MSEMKQPRKSTLREWLAAAADTIEAQKAEIEDWKAKFDAAVAQLEGEAKCFGAGFLCCGLLGVVLWWAL